MDALSHVSILPFLMWHPHWTIHFLISSSNDLWLSNVKLTVEILYLLLSHPTNWITLISTKKLETWLKNCIINERLSSNDLNNIFCDWKEKIQLNKLPQELVDLFTNYRTSYQDKKFSSDREE